MNKLKIALCLSGGLRNFKDTQYSFEFFLLNHHDVDVFFYGLENKEGKEKNKEDLLKLYNPKKFVINDEKEYEKLSASFNTTKPFFAFYNIKKCNELKIEYEKNYNFEYDLVIRARTDYFWFRSLTEQELSLAKDNILIPQDWAFKGVKNFARSDVFAVGNSTLMNVYSSIYDSIEKYVKEIGFFHPESICGYHILINNIPNIENDRCVVFEYPCKRVEKYIHPHKHIKYFDVPDIENEDDFLKQISDKRKLF